MIQVVPQVSCGLSAIRVGFTRVTGLTLALTLSLLVKGLLVYLSFEAMRSPETSLHNAWENS